MFKRNIYDHRLLAALTLGAGVLLSGCTDDVDTAQLRVIHASPDAPAVNVRLGSVTEISDLDYGESSGFASVFAGQRDVAVEAIIPGGNADVITVPGFSLGKDSRSTIIAVNNTASIEPLVADESAAVPGADEVAIVVVHASPDAAIVDVYVTAPGVDVNAVNPDFSFDFKGQVDAGALPAGTYRIQVTGQNSKTVVFDSGPVDLTAFAGQKLMIAALSTVNSTSRAASPIKLLVATDNAHLTLLDVDTGAGARVVHASPDAGTAASGPVEVWASSTALPVSPTRLIPSITYDTVLPGADQFLPVPGGDYVFDVAPADNNIGNSVYTSPAIPLESGTEYSVIAAGYVLTSPEFRLLATADNNRSVITQASVKVIHAAPAAGVVDVYVTPAGAFTAQAVADGLAGAPLLDDFAFPSITDYVAVAPDAYDIRVVAGGVVAIDIENVNLVEGGVYTAIAREPIDSGLPDDFNLILLTN